MIMFGDALADADAEDEDELLIMMFLSLDFNSSTCFPHLGQTTQSLSMSSPQCLQYF